MSGITYHDLQRTAPAWAADGVGAETLLPGGGRLDAAQFPTASTLVITLTAAAAAAATTLAVAALPGPIPAGTLLFFGEVGELARVATAAAAGATSLAVNALPSALELGDSATIPGLSTRVPVAGGTLLGRTSAERAAGVGLGPWASGDDEVWLLAQDLTDATHTPDADLYRHGQAVREDALPGWDTLSAAAQAAIRTHYQCFRTDAHA